jgi:hypothetical protein
VASSDSLKVEAHVLFYYNHEKKLWQLYCPFQEGTGGTTNSIECVDNDRSLAWLGREGYDCVGSVHSHCAMSAFQSGTDKDDEFSNTDGFHVTIGKMGDEVMDIHCRSICTILGDPNTNTAAERQQLPFYLQDFIEGLPDFSESPFEIPPKIQTQLINYYLANRDDLVDYPKSWPERVTLPQKKTWSYQANGAPQQVVGSNRGGTVNIQGKIFKLDDKGGLVPYTEDEQKQLDEYWERRMAEWKEEEELKAEEMALLKGKTLEEVLAEQADEALEAEEQERMADEQGRLFGVS